MSDEDTDSDVSTLEEAVSVLQQHDPSEVADVLDSQYHSAYQEIYDDGHDAGLGEINRKFEKAKSRAEELKEKLQSKEEEIQQLREEQPDTDQLYEQWKEQELQPVKEELDSLKGRVKQSSRKEAKRSVRDRIAKEVGDEFIADLAVEKFSDRIKVDDQGDVQFLRPNGQPYATRSDQDPSDLFARDVVEEIPEPYRNGNEQGGPRSTEKTASNGEVGSDSGFTKQDLTDPAKAAEFRKQFDSKEEFLEAKDSLPEE